MAEGGYILLGGMPFISCRAYGGGVDGVAALICFLARGIMPAFTAMKLFQTCYDKYSREQELGLCEIAVPPSGCARKALLTRGTA